MDNLCHTLVGAALARAGLGQRSRLAGATLMVAANLPDLDVLVFATNTPSIEFRRGWTHGILAQAALPVALTAVMMALGRRGVRKEGAGPPLSGAWLLALSYIGLYSHVFLDYLNTYGVRLLTPLDWRWFYGDAVFIVDPWLWLLLGAGVWLSRRSHSTRPARVALTVAACYIAGMMVSARVARAETTEAWVQQQGSPPQALMVGPVAAWPFERQVILDAGDRYITGRFHFLRSPRVMFDRAPVLKNDAAPVVAAAQRDPALRSFLVWSRFPFYTLERGATGTSVSVGDMRFAGPNPMRRLRTGFRADTVVPE